MMAVERSGWNLDLFVKSIGILMIRTCHRDRRSTRDWLGFRAPRSNHKTHPHPRKRLELFVTGSKGPTRHPFQTKVMMMQNPDLVLRALAPCNPGRQRSPKSGLDRDLPSSTDIMYTETDHLAREEGQSW